MPQREDGLAISATQRMSRRFQYTVNYTFAKSRDEDSNDRDFNRQGTYHTICAKRDAAYSKSDVRHSGNLNALSDLGEGFPISTLLLIRIGMPVKPLVGADSQNDGNTVNDRPIVNGQVLARDAFRAPGFFDWDMRLLKEFRFGEQMRLIVSIEGFNLKRSTNQTFNGDGESVFGRPLATNNPNTRLPFVNNTALIPTFTPGIDRFGGPRQGQIGVRFVF